MLVWDCAISVICSLHGFAICGKSLNLEPKYGPIVAYIVRRSLNYAPISFNALHASGTGELMR